MRPSKLSVAIFSLIAGFALNSCMKSTNPVGDINTLGPKASLNVAFSKGTSGIGFPKTSVGAAVDSIRIDSAVVVFQKIRFVLHADSVSIDSTGHDLGDDNEDSSLVLFGPFVVHVRDTVAIDFADQVVPAGTYDGVVFKIHRLTPGERCEDSDDHDGVMRTNTDPLLTGYSIVVWGAVDSSGTWKPFVYKLGEELQFRLKGNFVVSLATSTVNFALNFNIGNWFKDPVSGALLDPNNPDSQRLIREAIVLSFDHGIGGRDDDHNGHPDSH
jgi:hypothetical protein